MTKIHTIFFCSNIFNSQLTEQAHHAICAHSIELNTSGSLSSYDLNGSPCIARDRRAASSWTYPLYLQGYVRVRVRVLVRVRVRVRVTCMCCVSASSAWVSGCSRPGWRPGRSPSGTWGCTHRTCRTRWCIQEMYTGGIYRGCTKVKYTGDVRRWCTHTGDVHIKPEGVTPSYG